MSYLNCPVCHLSLRVRSVQYAPEYCPRCIGRRRGAIPLFASPLPMRDLVETDQAVPEAADQPRKR